MNLNDPRSGVGSYLLLFLVISEAKFTLLKNKLRFGVLLQSSCETVESHLEDGVILIRVEPENNSYIPRSKESRVNGRFYKKI